MSASVRRTSTEVSARMWSGTSRGSRGNTDVEHPGGQVLGQFPPYGGLGDHAGAGDQLLSFAAHSAAFHPDRLAPNLDRIVWTADCRSRAPGFDAVIGAARCGSR